jgi:predicted metal-dependent peptidase
MANIKDKQMYDRIIRSRIQLLMKFPFYGTLALSLEVVEDETIGTLATDGQKFYYNPEYVKTLSEGEVNWATAHEVMHCALGHMWRRGSRQKEKFNIAADYSIHSILKENEADDFKMAKGWLYDKKFDNMSAEEIYEMLPDPPSTKMGGCSGQGQGQGQNQQGQGSQNGQNQGNGKNQGNGGYPQTMDDHSKWDDAEVQKDGQQKQKDWLEKMVSAAEISEAKSQGKLPGMIKRLIGQIKKPQKNWRQLLAEFVQFEIFDYGFVPPDRRCYGYGEIVGIDVLMPDFNEEIEKVQDMVFVIDTSGSIGDREMVTFFSELIGMMQQFNNAVRGHIIYADADVAAACKCEAVT